MELIRDGRRFPRAFSRSSVALGNFDGVHVGHRALIGRMAAQAARDGGDAVVYTFEPHPVRFFFPERPPFLLTTLEQKLELLEAAGVRTVIVATFDADYASQTPDTFARDVLAGGLAARAVVIGYDFTFGRGRAGNPEVLVTLGRTYGFGVEVLPPVTVGGEPVSSSRIRKAVAAGAVEEASHLLGRPFAIRGRVVEGRRRGAAQLGFPTANIESENEVRPAGGVYAAWVRILGAADRAERQNPAAVNIGTAPTFGGGRATTVEAHLLDFTGSLYGERLEVAFVGRLREERTFPDPGALKAQIAADVAAVRARLA